MILPRRQADGLNQTIMELEAPSYIRVLLYIAFLGFHVSLLQCNSVTALGIQKPELGGRSSNTTWSGRGSSSSSPELPKVLSSGMCLKS